MTLSPGEFQALLDSIRYTEDHELTCDEWLETLSSYLEAQPVEQAGPAFLLVRQHLDLCPECREEYALMIQALKTTEL